MKHLDRKHFFLFSCLCVLCFCGQSSAQLDAEKDSPYQLQVVVRVADHPPFTEAFKKQVKRELGDGLQAAFGDLARVELSAAELPRWSPPEPRARLEAAVIATGYQRVDIDPRGFRSGSLNEPSSHGATVSGH